MMGCAPLNPSYALWPHRASDERGRRRDRDIAKGLRARRIAVSRNDQIRMAVDRQLEKFVVLRIAAGSDAFRAGDRFGGGQHLRQARSEKGVGHCCDMRSLQDVEDARLRCRKGFP